MSFYRWYNDGTDGDWSDPTRWRPAGPPDSGADVEIDAGTSTVHDANGLIGSLTLINGYLTVGDLEVDGICTITDQLPGAVSLGGGLYLAGGGSSSASAFVVASKATLDFAGGTFNLSGGAITGSGTVAVINNGTLSLGNQDVLITANFEQSFGTVDGTGRLTIQGNSLFSPGPALETGSGTTELQGATTVDASGDLALDGGRVLQNDGSLDVESNSKISLGYNFSTFTGTEATIINKATGVFDFQGDGQGITNNGVDPSLFKNAGTVKKSSGSGASLIQVVFTNTGTVLAQSGTLEFDGDFVNTDATAGAISVSSGATLYLTGGGSSSATAFDVDGTLDFSTGTFTLGAGAIGGSGTVQINNDGNLLLGNKNVVISANFEQSFGTVDGTGRLTIQGNSLFSPGPALETGSGTTELRGATTIDASGGLALDNGRVLQNDGSLVVNGGSTISLGYNPSTGTGTNATIKNTATGVFDFQGNGQFITNNGSNPSAFINAGTVKKSSGTGTSTIQAAFTSTGSVQALTGTLEFGATGNSFGGTLGGSTFVTIGGASSFANLTIGGTVTVTNNSGVTIDETGPVTVGGKTGAAAKLVNKGTYNLDSDSGIGVGTGAGSLFANTAGATLAKIGGTGVSHVAVRLTDSTNGAISAQTGTLSLDGGATISGPVSGAGTLGFGGGTATLNSGTSLTVANVALSGGANVNLGVSLGYGGALTQRTGTTLGVGAKTLMLTGAGSSLAGSVTGTGMLGFGGGTATLNSGTSLTVANVALSGGANVNLGVSLGYGGALTQGTGTTLGVGAKTLMLTGAGSSLAGSVTGTGTLAFGGGSQALNTGLSLGVSNWSLSGTEATTLNTNLTYAGKLVTGTTSTLNIASGKTLTLTGTGDSLAGTLNGPGTVAVAAGKTVAVSTLAMGNTEALKNSGTVNQGDKVTMSSGTISNLAGATWNITNNVGVGLVTGGTGTFTNAGRLAKTAGTGTSSFDASLTETGSIAIATGTLAFNGARTTISGGVSGAGTLRFGAGIVTLSPGTSLTEAGLIIADTGTKVTLGSSLAYGGTFNQASGTTLSIGTNTLSLGGHTTLAGSISGAGTLDFTGGTVALGAATIGAGTWKIEDGAVVNATTSRNYGGTFVDGTSSIKLATGTVLNLTGPASFTGSTVDGGSLQTRSASTSVAGLTLGGGAAWSNYGTVTQTKAVTIGDAAGSTANITNATGATYNITVDAGITLAAGASGTFTNQGLLEKTSGSKTSTIRLTLVNKADVTAASGTLDIAGAISGTGNLNITGAATLKVVGSVASTQKVNFSASGGTLAVRNTSGFKAPIAGFATGDTLDLTAFGFDPVHTTVSFVENAANTRGTLTVKDGALLASFTLLGQYIASGFQPAADSGTGTAIVYNPPPASPHVLLATTQH